jgi:hypothetical protein
LDLCTETCTNLNAVFRKGHYDVRYLAMDVVMEASETLHGEGCGASFESCREVDL